MLDAIKLGCARGARVILSNIDLRIADGEVVAVLGANGAGKSTLLATLAGELAAASGSVHIDGRPLISLTSTERARRLAVLSQTSVLAFAFVVEDVVALGRLPHHSGVVRDRQIVEQALDEADALHLTGRNYLQLSGGERQRVHLARVLAQIWETPQPILLMDEPTAGLDIAHQQLALETARRLAGRGGSVLVAVHDLNLAARYADRILLLHEGRTAGLGAPWQILQSERIEQVFGVRARVLEHPQWGCPLVVM